jgi:ABC-2 type transport system ATP-binding protein
MGEPALRFRAVAKTYEYSHLGRTTLTPGIESLDLEIADGEAFGLLGLNGSGKTTTFKLALGLLRPTSGAVTVFGRPPSDAVSRAEIGYLPELPYFYPFLTPRETLLFYGRLSALPAAGLAERVDKALESVGLSAFADRPVAKLSKGTVQRVGLAQATLHDPRLVILDEPVSGLDPLAIKQFRETLSSLNAKGKTLLVSSHSISEIEKLCHRVGILKGGKLVRVAAQAEWAKADGGLEGLFVETVR